MRLSYKLKKPYPGIGLCNPGRRLFGGWDDADRATVSGALDGELNRAGGLGEQGVILADADAFAGMELGAALTHDDVARQNELTAVALDAQAF